MKKILCLICALLMALSLAGCGTEYADTNGADNYDLQHITDSDIIDLSTGSSGLSYHEETIGGLSSKEYNSKNFNGVEQLYLNNYFVNSDVRIYIGHMSVTAGNFRMVVINNDEIIFDIPLDSFNETYWFEDINGSFSIHVAGESAAVDFYFSVE